MEKKKRGTIVLVEPKYPHGKRKRAYLPGSLLNLGSRLMKVGFAAKLVDLNRVELLNHSVREELDGADFIGITCIGTPYLSEVRDTVVRLREEGYNQPVLIGGEGIVRLTPEQFAGIFRDLGVVEQIQGDEDIRRVLGLTLTRLPTKFEVSMVSMLRTLDEGALRDYLTNEFCLFLSHGCVYSCSFCGAAKDQREVYRELGPLLEEVEFIAAFLERIGHKTCSVYLSNLDAMQSVGKLEASLREVHEIMARHGVHFQFRALATTHFTARAVRRDPLILERLHRYGLSMLGFGVDGVAKEVWERYKKLHNSLEDFYLCVAACKAAGIEPEALMVVGLLGETPAETLAALLWSLKQAYFKAIPVRSYLGKNIPGSKFWESNPDWVRLFLNDPRLLLNLDYTMFASEVTHPNQWERWRANAAYAFLLTLLLPTAYTTPPLFPLPRNPVVRRLVDWVNGMMPEDR